MKSVTDVVSELNFANTHYSNYLLNTAPNDQGLMDQNVIDRLKEIGNKVEFSNPITKLPECKKVHQGVTVSSSSIFSKEYKAEHIIDANLLTRWSFDSTDKDPWIELDFGKPQHFNKVVCGEFRRGVDAFEIEALVKGKWKTLTKGEAMTHNFNRSFDEIKARKFRMSITKWHGTPKVAEFTLVRY